MSTTPVFRATDDLKKVAPDIYTKLKKASKIAVLTGYQIFVGADRKSITSDAQSTIDLLTEDPKIAYYVVTNYSIKDLPESLLSNKSIKIYGKKSNEYYDGKEGRIETFGALWDMNESITSLKKLGVERPAIESEETIIFHSPEGGLDSTKLVTIKSDLKKKYDGNYQLFETRTLQYDDADKLGLDVEQHIKKSFTITAQISFERKGVKFRFDVEEEEEGLTMIRNIIENSKMERGLEFNMSNDTEYSLSKDRRNKSHAVEDILGEWSKPDSNVVTFFAGAREEEYRALKTAHENGGIACYACDDKDEVEDIKEKLSDGSGNFPHIDLITEDGPALLKVLNDLDRATKETVAHAD